MNKIDKLLRDALKDKSVSYVDYDYGKLSTSELKELISDGLTDERALEILTPVQYMNRDTNSIRKKLERLSVPELTELTKCYEQINEEV